MYTFLLHIGDNFWHNHDHVSTDSLHRDQIPVVMRHNMVAEVLVKFRDKL